jgi:hypothetical protein
MGTVNNKEQRKHVSVDDVTAALREMAELRERLDWRRRDLRLMFLQAPELRTRFETFQRAGGVTADEWVAFIEGRMRHRLCRSRGNLRLLTNNRPLTTNRRSSGGTDAA